MLCFHSVSRSCLARPHTLSLHSGVSLPVRFLRPHTRCPSHEARCIVPSATDHTAHTWAPMHDAHACSPRSAVTAMHAPVANTFTRLRPARKITRHPFKCPWRHARPLHTPCMLQLAHDRANVPRAAHAREGKPPIVKTRGLARPARARLMIEIEGEMGRVARGWRDPRRARPPRSCAHGPNEMTGRAPPARCVSRLLDDGEEVVALDRVASVDEDACDLARLGRRDDGLL